MFRQSLSFQTELQFLIEVPQISFTQVLYFVHTTFLLTQSVLLSEMCKVVFGVTFQNWMRVN